MKELNQDKLIALVDDFLQPFGCSSDFDSDFSYDPESEIVYFSILVTARSDRLFKKYILDHFNFQVPNIFTISLLHEVGHYFTLSNFSEMELETAHLAKKTIQEMLKMDSSNDEIYTLYFDLNIEKIATAWAIDYYKNHTKRCERFYSKFLKELQDQYEKLNLTE